jgi:hypothetical protein
MSTAATGKYSKAVVLVVVSILQNAMIAHARKINIVLLLWNSAALNRA